MMRDYFEAAAAEAGLTLAQLRSRRRDKIAYEARQKAYAACRADGFTLTQIADFANRDHTSVLNGLKRYEMRQK
jgi:chromosomal replication initiation ATPase DnaA